MNIDEAPRPIAPAAGVMVFAPLYPRGTRIGLHAHREAQLLFAVSGVMQVATPSGRWLVPPRRAVWLPPRFEHAVDALADLEMRSVYLAPDWLAGCDGGPRLDREFVVAVGPLLREAILALFDPVRCGARADALARLALTELAEADDAMTFMPMPSDPRARRVAEIVLSDPASLAGLEDLARSAGLSARSLTRIFPAETDLTFKAWRQRARIMSAVEALGGGAPVKQVAARLGFSSAAAFSHAFRQVLGTAPSAFAARTRPQPSR